MSLLQEALEKKHLKTKCSLIIMSLRWLIDDLNGLGIYSDVVRSLSMKDIKGIISVTSYGYHNKYHGRYKIISETMYNNILGLYQVHTHVNNCKMIMKVMVSSKYTETWYYEKGDVIRVEKINEDNIYLEVYHNVKMMLYTSYDHDGNVLYYKDFNPIETYIYKTKNDHYKIQVGNDKITMKCKVLFKNDSIHIIKENESQTSQQGY